MSASPGAFSVSDAMALLRDHGPEGSSASWTPAGGYFGATVCMHAGVGPVRISQTTGSMVACLGAGPPMVWLTGTAAPCTSVFKPVWLDAGLPEERVAPGRDYDPAVRWWRHERLHRATLRNYPAAIAQYAHHRDALQDELVHAAAAGRDGTVSQRRALTEAAFRRVDCAESDWLAAVRAVPDVPLAQRIRTAGYRRAWAARSRDRGVPA